MSPCPMALRIWSKITSQNLNEKAEVIILDNKRN
jgi:hypothetical protein